MTLAERRVGMGGHQSPVNDKDEWITPPHILAPLGTFDLDPCAAPDQPWPCARQSYCAQREYAAADDGLSMPWFGRVWLNPPYGRPAIIGPWMQKMAAHQNGIALIFARTETDLFFETVWNVARAVLFLRGRLHFHHVDGRRADHNAGAPSCLVAYGPDNAACLATCGLDGQFVRLR